VSFCANDATPLVPLQQPVAPPKRTYGLLALILAIVLVVVVGVGAFLLLRNKTNTGGATVTPGTSVTSASTSTSGPANTTDWTRGVSQQWQKQYDDVVATSPDVWMVSGGTSIYGLDPSTGVPIWQLDANANDWNGCTATAFNGQWACIEPDPAIDHIVENTVCLINVADGTTQSCTSLAGALTVQDGSEASWYGVWFADNAVIVSGSVWQTEPYHTAARLSLPSLSADWAQSYTSCGYGPTDSSDLALVQRDTQGVAGNVLWVSAVSGDPLGPAAVDIRNGEPLFPPSSQGGCGPISPLDADTFLTTPNVRGGPMALPGGGQINIVNTGGGIQYTSEQLPTVPVTFTPSGISADTGMYTLATLGVNGADWSITLPLQQMVAGAGYTYLRGAASGDTLVVVGGNGQVVAVNTASGQLIWTATVPTGESDSSDIQATIVGNVVAVTTSQFNNDEVTLLNLATGQQVGQFPGNVIAAPDGSSLAVRVWADDGNGNQMTTISRYVPVQ